MHYPQWITPNRSINKGGKKMKKILIIGILLFVLIAFSGVASATYVTDKQIKKDYYNGKYAGYATSYVLHYSSTHIRFIVQMRYYDFPYRDYYRDYQKTGKNTIIERNRVYYSGKDQTEWYYPKYKKVNTKLSVYSLYKYERAKHPAKSIAGVFTID
jgi:hypothetical protein